MSEDSPQAPSPPNPSPHFFRASAEDFKRIPGSPIAYWVSERFREVFRTSQPMGEMVTGNQGLATADNGRFLRLWQEVAFKRIGFHMSNREEALESGLKWFPHNKGGPYRKWYGNQDYLVNWENDGEEIQNFRDDNGKLRSRPQNIQFYFKESLSWSDVTSSENAFRFYSKGFIHNTTAPTLFNLDPKLNRLILAFSNNHFASAMVKILNPTIHFHIGYFNLLPYPEKLEHKDLSHVDSLIKLAQEDWDDYERSWDFKTLPLLRPEFRGESLETTYAKLRAHFLENTLKMKALEEENNRIFIEAYGLEEELTKDVPLEEITLTSNPHYRYRLSGERWEEATELEKEAELESRFLEDSMKDFISYGMGVLFGRYSLDQEGLILGNAKEGLKDFKEMVKAPSFLPEEDNILPLVFGNYLPKTAGSRMKDFLKATFGEAHFHENLAFLEKALTGSGKKKLSLDDYLEKGFFQDHVRAYQKRPIYWLFSSPGGHFQALVYMHRMTSDTIHILLNEYLRDLIKTMGRQLKHLEERLVQGGLSSGDKSQVEKEKKALQVVLEDLKGYEESALYPLAIENMEIDLDDGVRANYEKIGKALKKI